MEMNNKINILDIPDEILHIIFQSLNFNFLKNVRLVNKQFLSIVKEYKIIEKKIDNFIYDQNLTKITDDFDKFTILKKDDKVYILLSNKQYYQFTYQFAYKMYLTFKNHLLIVTDDKLIKFADDGVILSSIKLNFEFDKIFIDIMGVIYFQHQNFLFDYCLTRKEKINYQSKDCIICENKKVVLIFTNDQIYPIITNQNNMSWQINININYLLRKFPNYKKIIDICDKFSQNLIRKQYNKNQQYIENLVDQLNQHKIEM